MRLTLDPLASTVRMNKKVTKIDQWLASGSRLHREGRIKQAVSYYNRVLDHAPHHADALHLKGAAALQSGNMDEAIQLIGQAIAAGNPCAAYYCDLGTALFETQDLVSAEQAYLEALKIDPGHLDALYNLANLLRQRKQLKEALTLYTAVLERSPQHSNAWNNIGLVLLDINQRSEALSAFEQAIKSDPKNVQAILNLGYVQKAMGDLRAAIETYRSGLALDPNYSDMHANLGTALTSLGALGEGVEHLVRAIELKRDNATAHSALIFALDFAVGISTFEQQRARRDWYECCIRPKNIVPLQYVCHPDPNRKLRIGYVSADFRGSSAAMAFGPMLFDFDRQSFEVYCYANQMTEDSITAQIREQVTGYRQIAGLSDQAAAQCIVSDKIDILIDLSGHMSGNRLGIFAYKPAPIQATGWGYANGTGMPEIDGIFADRVYITPDDEVHFVERVIEVPCMIAYRPFATFPPIEPAQLDRMPHFGCFSRLSKITDFSIDLWARLLREIPDAELLLKSSQEASDASLQILQKKFSDRAVSPQRIRFLPHSDWTAHMRSFGEVDILLDPTPHGGGISLVDGVAMGVPTLTLKGDTVPSRLGAALLHVVGLDDWVATSEEEFIALAKKKCADRAALSQLRTELRDRLLSSPLGDAQAYVRAVEVNYRQLWQERCEKLIDGREERLQEAKRLLVNEQAAAALTVLEPLIALNGKDVFALHLAGLAAFGLDDGVLAIDLLRKAVDIDQSNVDTWVDLGTVLTAYYRPAEAIKAYRRALHLRPDYGLVHYNLGNVLLSQNILDEAVEAYGAACKAMPRDPKAINNLGVVYERKGELQQAEACFKKALMLDATYPEAYENLARLGVEREHYKYAVAQFERALSLNPRLHHIRYELAVWYDKLGLRERMPSLAVFTFSTARGSAEQGQTDIQSVISAITLMVKQDLQDRQRSTRSIEEELRNFSARLMELDHPGKIWLLEELLSINPNHISAYWRLGLCHYHDCHFEEAHRVWMQGLERRDALAHAHGLADAPFRILDSSWYMAIGHIAQFDAYIKSVMLGWRDKKALWLWRVHDQKIPNQSYLDYWRPHIHLIEPGQAGDNTEALEQELGIYGKQLQYVTDNYFVDRLADGRCLWHMDFAMQVQREWETQGKGPLLHLSEADQTFGAEQLTNLGVPKGAWFVCFHVREPGFWWKWNRYHPSTRDADVSTYLTAMKAVVEQGGWVIRVGDNTMKKLPQMDGIIDYAHSEFKCQRMDTFLCGACRFFVGVNSGLSLVPPTFGCPCVLTNYTPLSIPCPSGYDLFIPKLFRRRGEQRFLSFEEMYVTGTANAQVATQVPEGIEVVDNTDEEINEVVTEMQDEMAGRITPEEMAQIKDLRSRYEEIARRYGGLIGSRMSGRFLMRHPELLKLG